MALMRKERQSHWPLDTLWDANALDGLFRDMLRTFFGGAGVLDRAFLGGGHPMRVEEYFEDDGYVIRAELPGLDPNKDVEITFSDGILHLRAEREERSEEELPDGFRSEFHYGLLSRSIQLPDGVTEADVAATYKDGILEVRVPVPEPAEPQPPKKIQISQG